jgi:hypothetical protein
MKGFAFTSAQDTHSTGPITMTPGATTTTGVLMNIGGTDGIVGTITIGIDALV